LHTNLLIWIYGVESRQLNFAHLSQTSVRQDQGSAGMEGHGNEKYKDASLIATSANRSWSLLSAEVRSHQAGEIAAFTPQNAFITQTIQNTRSNVSIRSSGGVRQEVLEVTPGTIWLCPAGICEEATRLVDDFPEVLHVYLPPHSFLRHIGEGSMNFGARDLRYQAQVTNPAVVRATQNIRRELYQETCSGGLKMDALAVELIGTLARDHAEVSSSRPLALATGILDRRRLDRVLDYIEVHLDVNIRIGDLAEVACFSLFHFVRAFHLAMGRAPYAYLSERRLDRAKQLLAYSNASLADISLTCRFSGQANFTKAFTRAMGLSPGRFRKSAR
jgi:AraC family transcriptional regulator